jgi:hypothetical protein
MSVRNLHEVRFMLFSTLFCRYNIWLGGGPFYNTYTVFILVIYTVGPNVCRTRMFARRCHQWILLDLAQGL